MDVEPNELVDLLGRSAVVHQAVGMISGQTGTSLRHAADRLIAESTTMGRSVEDIAIDVVGRRLRVD
jgi:hypothetical protein